jgi:uncharacterized protein YybS (DUF2232 family)
VKDSSTRSLVESGLLTAVSIVLMLFSIYMPGFYFIGIFLWPLPITFIYIRHGAKYSIMSLVVSGIVMAMLSDPITATTLIGTFGILGLIMGYCVSSKKTVFFTLLFMSISYFIAMIVMIKGLNLLTGLNIIEEAINRMMSAIENVKSLFLESGASKENVEMLFKALPTAEILKMMLPGALIVSSVIVSFLSYIIAGNLFKRFGYNLNRVPSFTKWYIPVQIALGLLMLMILGFILNKSNIEYGEGFFITISIVFRFVFLVNGMAYAAYFLRGKNIPIALVVVILFFGASYPLSEVIVISGMVDYTLNLRKLDPKRQIR